MSELLTRGPLGSARRGLTRRQVIKTAAATGAAVGMTALAAPAVRAQSVVRIGYVTPQSGPLAAFAEADAYVLSVIGELTAGGVETAAGTVNVEVLVRDTQSDPNRAAEVTRDLIVNEGVTLIVVASTPETTNPVSTVCEQEEIPCISTMAPWQPWYMSRQADPTNPQPFLYTYHFFWGLEDIIATYTGMWNQLETNKVVGGLFPNDGDGNAWGDPVVGIGPGLNAAGYTLVDPGRYENLNQDFTAQINAFRQNNCQIVTGVVIPPDFTTFWQQANQQGYRPPIATIAKAILFPSSVEALGPIANNLSSEVWWTPSHPFTSSLTGATGADLAAGFTAFSGRPWTQPIGFIYALMEVALDVIKRAADPSDYDSVLESIQATDLDTIVGHVQWGTDAGGLPPPIAANVSKTPLVGGQWRLNDGAWDLVIVENGAAPEIATQGVMEPIV